MTEFPTFLLGILATLATLWLMARRMGFAAQSPQDYADEGPAFDIRRHLNGPLDCEGVIYGPTGRVSTRFTARMQADWTGNTGRMTEHFRYSGGTEQHREWRLTVEPDGRIRAEADDLVGSGSGRQVGASVNLSYRIRLPESAGGHVLNAVDWMYILDNGAIMNRSQFRKFGLKVGELVATMRPADTAARMAAE